MPLNRMRTRRWWVVAVVVALCAGGAWVWWSKHRAPADAATAPRTGATGSAGAAANGRDRPRPVSVATAVQADLPVTIDALGTVTPLRTVIVRPRVEGTLLEVSFREGQDVQAGDVLARLDARTFEVQLAQAEGNRARDEAQLAIARADLARYRTLLDQDSIARQQVEAQEALVRQLEGAVRAGAGAIDAARLQVQFSTVRAPIAGRTGLRQVDVGNLVRASDANGLVTLTQQTPITVVFSIPQDALPAVLARTRTGAQLAVEAWDRERTRKLADGTLLAVDNVIDATTGTVRLKAQFANADGALFPNQFVNARLQVDVRKAATVIPTNAVQQGAKGPFVYLVQGVGAGTGTDGATVALHPVKLGAAADGRVIVEEGLAPGAQVVVEGTERLREGSKVTVGGRGGGEPGARRRDGAAPEATAPERASDRAAPR
jgi:multidrug efflux system membrane fusion protein